MNVAYIDSSCVVARLFSEPGSDAIAARIATFDAVCASALLEAEVRAALAREHAPLDEDALDPVNWIHPARRLEAEIGRVLQAGYLKGADAWHLACALYFFESPAVGTFLTLDGPQRSVAELLGFQI